MSLVLDLLAALLCSGELGKEVCVVLLCKTSSVHGEFFFFLLLAHVAGGPGTCPCAKLLLEVASTAGCLPVSSWQDTVPQRFVALCSFC